MTEKENPGAEGARDSPLPDDGADSGEAFDPRGTDCSRNLSELIKQSGGILDRERARPIAQGRNHSPPSLDDTGISNLVPLHLKVPVIASAASLRAKAFPPLKFAIPGVVPEGLSILAGKPKIGKSWLMLDMALSVSGGTGWWDGAPCEQGSVLYLALEDNERRLQSRITKLLGPSGDWPADLHYATEWPRADDGGLDEIRAWLDKEEHPRFIGIDVIARFRALRDGGQSPYDCDYDAMSGLQRIASEYRVPIICAHHVRKNTTEMDPFEQVSGTLGLTGGVDTILVLQRDSNGMTLHGRGRDMSDIEKAVDFDQASCRWQLLGDADAARRSTERSKIISVLTTADAPLSPCQIALATGMDRNNLDQLLHKMVRAVEITKEKRGRYTQVTQSGPE